MRHQNSILIFFFLGINHESSFEAEVLANTKYCQIWGYDHSVSSFGPEMTNSLRHRAHFHAYSLAGQDKHGPNDNPPMYTLESLMRMNGTSAKVTSELMTTFLTICRA